MPKSNNADAFRILYDMMELSGIWPKDSPSVFYKAKAAILWLMVVAFSVGMTVDLIVVITDITKLSEILYVMVSVVFHLVKLAIFNSKKKTFLKMIDFLKEPVFLSYPDDLDHFMAKTIKRTSLMANFYRYLCMCCICMFTIYPVLDKKPLPFPFPYDLGKYRFIMYILQIIGVGTVAWNNSCLDSLPACLMGIGAAQLDILMGKLSRIGEDSEEEIVEVEHSVKMKRIIKELQQCVEHHLAIIQFIEYIETVFTAGILVQFMASVMVICNTLFHVVLISRNSGQFFMLANYFAVMVMELYIYCWYGNEVMWKSVFVSEACYFSKWYDYGTDVGQYLFIIMERSKRPLTISALKISKLSLTAFTSIIQWAYSYFALLLNVYYKNNSTPEKSGHI